MTQPSSEPATPQVPEETPQALPEDAPPTPEESDDSLVGGGGSFGHPEDAPHPLAAPYQENPRGDDQSFNVDDLVDLASDPADPATGLENPDHGTPA